MRPSRRRVIIDTDAKNEADDQFAIVHGLLSPTSRHPRADPRALRHPPVGSQHGGVSRGGRPVARPARTHRFGARGERCAVRHSRRADARGLTRGAADHRRVESCATKGDPLFVAFLGPLTDMASAILLDPGDRAPRGDRDLDRRPWLPGLRRGTRDRVQPLQRHSTPPTSCSTRGSRVWQVPSDVYTKVSVSYAELAEKIGDSGPLGPVSDQAVARVERDVPPGADRVPLAGRLARRSR